MLCEIQRLNNTQLQTTFSYPLNLHSVTYPWLVHEDYRTDESETEKAKLIEFKVQGEELGKKLETVLNQDPHLKECCVNPLRFAALMDVFIGHFLEERNNQISEEEKFDADFKEFTEQIYEEPFKALTFSHVFNFDAYSDQLDFGNQKIRKVSVSEIPLLLGENTTYSFLHPFKSGEYFVVAEAGGVIDDDLQRMRDAHESAEELVRVLQYYKDGVVHLNYTANFFRPLWLNRLRKIGMLYWGDNRRLPYEQGKKRYFIDANEHEELKTWWNLFSQPQIQTKFGENRNALGRIIEFAGSYFESSHTQIESIRTLIDLSIALEAAFSPHNDGEISFQLSQLAAEFVGSDSVEKNDIFAFVKRMYKKRSRLLHGNPKSYTDDFVVPEDLEKFSSIIRRGLLRYVALYIDGEVDHKRVIDQIRNSLFDPDIRSKLKERSDINRLIRESII